jgi:glycosyltransferase involved in cell wall biosynthesis
MFRSMFRSPQAIIYLSDAERRFVQSHFHVEHIPSTVAGVGVETPIAADGARFRERYGIGGPFLLYAGRIEPSKNCDELFDHFLRYRREHHAGLQLVLLGKAGMEIPDDPHILSVGFVSEEEKSDALQAAEVFVLPSQFESLSIASLEAWRVGTPVLANGRSQVLREHCLRSNGGLFYSTYAEFAAAVQLLMDRPGLRTSLGAAGQRYVADQYGWGRIEADYLNVLRLVTSGVRPETS